MELVLVSAIAILGLVVGLSEVSININHELEDVGSAFSSVQQSDNLSGTCSHKGHKGHKSGSGFCDQADFCDGQDDVR